MTKSVTTTVQSGGLATTVAADAVAIGKDTLTVTTADTTITSTGQKIVATGTVTAQAIAEPAAGGTSLADATTDVAVSGAERLVVRTKSLSVETATGTEATSVTTFKAVDGARNDLVKIVTVDKQVTITDTGKQVVKTKEVVLQHDGVTEITTLTKVKEVPLDHPLDIVPDVSGNIATLDVHADALGTDTLVSVDTSVLAVEDTLSQSTLLITSAIG